MNTNISDYPEIKWPVKPSAVWRSTAMLGYFLVSLIVIILIVPVLFFFFALPALFISYLIYGNWTTHHEAELTLDANGVYYTGWKRRLSFQDMESVYSFTSKRRTVLVFRLNRLENSPWKFNLPPSLKMKVVIFSLAGFKEKPTVISQTVSRYFNRE